MKTDAIPKIFARACKAGSTIITIVPRRLDKLYAQKVLLPRHVDECRRQWPRLSSELFQHVRRQTLDYIATNAQPEHGPGAYSYKPSGATLLYASCYAALTRDLYDDLHNLSLQQKVSWCSYIQKHQSDDGLFRDPCIESALAEQVDWWGWRHLTLHALMALAILGGVAPKSFQILEPFRQRGQMTRWLETRNWQGDPASVSNEIQNHAVILQYARDFQEESWCEDTLQEMYMWLDKHQDATTGLWGIRFDTPMSLSVGVQTGYHIWLLYFYDRRPICRVEQIVDSCLATQNKLGGYGCEANASACEDIDSIDPLTRLYFLTDYRRDDIRKSLKKTLPWVMTNLNPDGGWVFRRCESFQYGHPLMYTRKEESSMFPTWFRTLSLAYLWKVLAEELQANILWKFADCPGHQFWRLPLNC